jgi:hypothetical protein
MQRLDRDQVRKLLEGWKAEGKPVQVVTRNLTLTTSCAGKIDRLSEDEIGILSSSDQCWAAFQI